MPAITRFSTPSAASSTIRARCTSRNEEVRFRITAIELKRRAVLTAQAPVPFDVCFTDPDRFAQRARIAGTLKRAALIEGRVVYRRE